MRHRATIRRTMIFSDEFLSGIRSDPVEGVKGACNLVARLMDDDVGWSTREMDALEDFDLLMTELAAAKLLDPLKYAPAPQPVGATREHRASAISAAVQSVHEQCKEIEGQRVKQINSARMRMALGTQFAYEFSQADIDRIQSLLNELRAHIRQSDDFQPDHQQRLLARLEALQREIHKKVSDLDRFWGLVGEAGVVMAKLGNDAKPIVDRISEIAKIVWNTQGRAEELPSTAKAPQIGYEPGPHDSDGEA